MITKMSSKDHIMSTWAVYKDKNVNLGRVENV